MHKVKISAATDEMHSNAKSILAKAGEIQAIHNDMASVAGGMTPYFKGALPELLTQVLLDMKKKHKAMYEKIVQHSKDIDYAADAYTWTDQVVAKWFSSLGLMEHGIQGGRFKYINQIGNVNGEWGEFDMYTHDSLATGCNIACFTMALSSLGKNTTPEDVCRKNKHILETSGSTVDANNTHPTYVSGGELAKAYGFAYENGGKIDDYLALYEKNPGKYSAPVIKIPGTMPGEKFHFVVVQGRNPDDSYNVVDPYNQSQKVYSGTIYSAYQLSSQG
jgi:uncharacterized protein YukE